MFMRLRTTTLLLTGLAGTASPAMAEFGPIDPSTEMFYTGYAANAGGPTFSLGPQAFGAAYLPFTTHTVFSPFNSDVSATMAVSGLADLSSETLHAFAGAPLVVDSTGGKSQLYGVVQDATSDVEFGETYLFSIKGATSTTQTTLPFSMTVHGTFTYISGIEGGACCFPSATLIASVGHGSGPLSVLAAESTGWDFSSTYGYDASKWFAQDYSPSVVDTTITGSVTITGVGGFVPVELDLRANGGVGVADVSDTVGFSFDTLPSNVSFTTASGLFQQEAIPEPNTTTLLATGLAVVLVVGRKARPCGQT